MLLEKVSDKIQLNNPLRKDNAGFKLMRKVSIIVHEPSPRDNLPDDDKDDATL